jgi:hypothetical protein
LSKFKSDKNHGHLYIFFFRFAFYKVIFCLITTFTSFESWYELTLVFWCLFLKKFQFQLSKFNFLKIDLHAFFLTFLSHLIFWEIKYINLFYQKCFYQSEGKSKISKCFSIFLTQYLFECFLVYWDVKWWDNSVSGGLLIWSPPSISIFINNKQNKKNKNPRYMDF